MSTSTPSSSAPVDFIRHKVIEDNRTGKYAGRVMTRFPPEPNGYPHIGHAKSICLNFGLAAEFGGVCNLRFDDTNPATEDIEYVEAIKDAVRWLGFDWGDREYYASDYYEQLYAWAEKLVLQGDAYVCFLSEEQFKECRGTVMGPGSPSPYRDTPPAENLAVLRRMKAGEFDEGACVLRAKIDMASPNMKMRDPPMYRVKKAHHYRRGDAWCIYPLYDYAHGLSDALEGVTHSLCTLEFENNRELYDWYVAKVGFAAPPEQTEFARLDLTHVIVSKRYLRRLVEEGKVDGWDDPRMPTLAGLRRRGVPAAAIRSFVERVGVARTNAVVELQLLEHTIRETLHASAPRRLVVEQPLPVHIEGIGPARIIEAADFPAELNLAGSRPVPLSASVFIERADFAEVPAPGWKRLAPGGVVRLRHAGLIRCVEVQRGADGSVEGLRCARLAEDEAVTAGKGVGTIHWVDQATAVPCTLRVYEQLFAAERPGTERDLFEDLHPHSKHVIQGVAEQSLAAATVGAAFQFERLGFFAVDPDSQPGHLVFNRVVALKDGFAHKSEPRADAAPRKAPAPARGPALDAQAPSPEVTATAAAWDVRETVARALLADPARAAWAEAAVAAGASRADAANLACNDLAKADLGALPFGASEAGAALALVAAGALPRATLRHAIAEAGPDGLQASIRRLQAAAAAAPALDATIEALLAAHPAEASRLTAGDTKLVGFFLGQLKRTAPAADPAEARRLLTARVSA